jgi:hypothetical protein
MKKTISVTLIFILLNSILIGANTEEKKKVEPIGLTKQEALLNEPKEVKKSNQEIFERIKKSSIADVFAESLEIENIQIDLYVQFKNQKIALSKFKDKYSKTLTSIQNQYNFTELNNNNWEDYYYKLQNGEDTTYHELTSFFDIYENNYKNQEIKDLYNKNIQKLPYMSNAEKDVLFKTFNLLIPYTSNQLPTTPNLEMTRNIDFEDAVAYATKYASSPNSSDYGYFPDRDCTNFVSQILKAGGISETSTYGENENLGWWHVKKLYEFYDGYIHLSSKSWRVADTFAKYMGVYYSTESHYSFSLNVSKGDIIGFDEHSDGDWQHMAFAVSADNYSSTYNGKKYYDYKIAQHSKDYLAWVSSSTCGWEELEDKPIDYTYGIIRR